MTKSQFMRIILIVGSILIIVGVVLMAWMIETKDDTSVIKVKLEDGKTQALEFENLCLVPGQSCEYTLKLIRDRAETYRLNLDFVETDEGILKNFARVKLISSDGETICDDLLVNVFDGGDIVLDVDLSQNRNTELTVVYYLPDDIGNEAKGAEAFFELQITASNE